MFGSTAIEVAIGLIFVYMALSLVCSSSNEIIAQQNLSSLELDNGPQTQIANVTCRLKNQRRKI